MRLNLLALKAVQIGSEVSQQDRGCAHAGHSVLAPVEKPVMTTDVQCL